MVVVCGSALRGAVKRVGVVVAGRVRGTHALAVWRCAGSATRRRAMVTDKTAGKRLCSWQAQTQARVLLSTRRFSCAGITQQQQQQHSAGERETGFRTHTCAEMQPSLAGSQVCLAGWLASKRAMAEDLVFVVLRDHYATVQIKVTDREMVQQLSSVPLESTLRVKGAVAKRPADMVNPRMATGEVEVLAHSIDMLGKATNQPFRPTSDISSLPKEDFRLQHRPLDLRRQQPHNAITARARVAAATRRFLDQRDFLDIETPTLFKRTPGGAAEFLVPTQKRGHFYALVQSPQQYKQMLMVAGFDRYYQFARCYRDEGGRLDRQPEFTQVDLEMAFVTQEDVMRLTEQLVVNMWEAGCGITPPTPFPRMSFQEAMAQYGSDKPDTRFDMRITDATDIFAPHAVRVWQHVAASGGVIRGIKAEGAASFFTRKNMKQLQDYARGVEGEAVVFVHFDEDGSVRSPIFKDISSAASDNAVEVVKQELRNRFEASPGDVLLLSGAAEATLLPFLGKLRTKAASQLVDAGLLQLDPREFRFLWVVDFPLFEPHELEEGRLQACHHPFTAPHPEDESLVYEEGGAPTLARAQHFDVVVNGVELGGGSIRIHDPEQQLYILQNILKEEPAVFEQLLGALRYGAPPHGGIALGFDRAMLCMLAAEGATSLRDTIAFPKSFAGKELMSGSPSEVPACDLLTYHIRVVDEAS